MIDILLYITLISWVQPSPCEQAQAFKTVEPLQLHYVWKSIDDSGITPFKACVPSGATYVLMEIGI